METPSTKHLTSYFNHSCRGLWGIILVRHIHFHTRYKRSVSNQFPDTLPLSPSQICANLDSSIVSTKNYAPELKMKVPRPIKTFDIVNQRPEVQTFFWIKKELIWKLAHSDAIIFEQFEPCLVLLGSVWGWSEADYAEDPRAHELESETERVWHAGVRGRCGDFRAARYVSVFVL